jgi:hypothetical protein
VRPEALAGDGVDAPRRLAHADIGGDDDDIGQRVQVEAVVAVAPERVGDERDRHAPARSASSASSIS